jgi:hypothetical protein
MVRGADCPGNEVDVDESMNEELTIGPERTPQITPVVYLGKDSRAPTSFNHAMQRNRLLHRAYNRVVPRAGSLSFNL